MNEYSFYSTIAGAFLTQFLIWILKKLGWHEQFVKIGYHFTFFILAFMLAGLAYMGFLIVRDWSVIQAGLANY